MKFLSIDIGTGTQDIYLFQSGVAVENGFKLVVPSPTMLIFQQIKDATKRGEDLVLSGVTMGGGPSHWAARDHILAGNKVYATPNAARSFDDDLEILKESGFQIISEDEIKSLPSAVQQIELKDLDLEAIYNALGEFRVGLDDLAGAAVAVFDHGAAPPGYSDRQFRFDYLAERLDPVKSNARLSNLAFKRGEIPKLMTRLQAVEDSAAGLDLPLLVMDTAPAAVLGSGLDDQVRDQERILAVNIGNFHTIAFRLQGNFVEGVFEHHTGLLDRERLEGLLKEFASGSLTHDQIFADHGHGAMIHREEPFAFGRGSFDLVVTGPRRNMIKGAGLRSYFPAPFGDMMLTGCFGLLAAAGDKFPELGEEIKAALFPSDPGYSGLPPWELI